MKIKLRDMTPEQFRKWKAKNCVKITGCNDCIFSKVNCLPPSCYTSWVNNKNTVSSAFLNREIEIEVDCESILNEDEKEFLEAALRPFKKRILFIRKLSSSYNSKGLEFIHVLLDSSLIESKEEIAFPYFVTDAMYKNMQRDREYSIAELGLFKK